MSARKRNDVRTARSSKYNLSLLDVVAEKLKFLVKVDSRRDFFLNNRVYKPFYNSLEW